MLEEKQTLQQHYEELEAELEEMRTKLGQANSVSFNQVTQYQAIKDLVMCHEFT